MRGSHNAKYTHLASEVLWEFRRRPQIPFSWNSFWWAMGASEDWFPYDVASTYPNGFAPRDYQYAKFRRINSLPHEYGRPLQKWHVEYYNINEVMRRYGYIEAIQCNNCGTTIEAPGLILYDPEEGLLCNYCRSGIAGSNYLDVEDLLIILERGVYHERRTAKRQRLTA